MIKETGLLIQNFKSRVKKQNFFIKKILRHKKTKQKISTILTVYSLGQISNIKNLKKIARKLN